MVGSGRPGVHNGAHTHTHTSLVGVAVGRTTLHCTAAARPPSSVHLHNVSSLFKRFSDDLSKTTLHKRKK